MYSYNIEAQQLFIIVAIADLQRLKAATPHRVILIADQSYLVSSVQRHPLPPEEVLQLRGPVTPGRAEAVSVPSSPAPTKKMRRQRHQK